MRACERGVGVSREDVVHAQPAARSLIIKCALERKQAESKHTSRCFGKGLEATSVKYIRRHWKTLYPLHQS